MDRLDRALRIAAASGVLLVVLPLALPQNTLASAVLQNFVHVPVFALVAIASLRTVRARRFTSGRSPATHYLVALAVAAGIGAASEILQIPGPRHASIQDWIVDVASAMTALAFVRRHEPGGAVDERQRRWLGMLSIAGSLFVLAPLVLAALAYGYRHQQLPDLMRFHGAQFDAIDTYFLSGNPFHPEFRTLPEVWQKPDDPVSIRLVLPPITRPGLSLIEPYPDWRGYTALVIDLTNPGDKPVDLRLRIDDAEHNQDERDRFTLRFTLAPRTRETLRIPLSAVRDAPWGRQMEMAHIAGLGVHGTAPASTRIVDATRPADEIYVTRITLER